MSEMLAFEAETRLFTRCSRCDAKGPELEETTLDEAVQSYREHDWSYEEGCWRCPDCLQISTGPSLLLTPMHLHRWSKARQEHEVTSSSLLDVALLVLTTRKSLWDAFSARQWSEINTLARNIEYFITPPIDVESLSKSECLLLEFLHSLFYGGPIDMSSLAMDLPDDLMNAAMYAIRRFRETVRSSQAAHTST